MQNTPSLVAHHFKHSDQQGKASLMPGNFKGVSDYQRIETTLGALF